MQYRYIYIIVAVFALCNSSSAQRFGARAVLGLNASQIAGDQLAGFDKVGLTAGIQGTAELTTKLNLNVEFLYSERGSKPNIFNNAIDPDIHIKLQYIELPVYVAFHDWLDEEKGFYKAFAAAGFSYGRLIQAQTFDHFNDGDENLDKLVPYFNENDVSWMLGFGFRIGGHGGMSFRYTRSITLLLDAEKHDLDTYSLRPYFLTFRGEYIFK